ncbi:hypothetical protein FACS189432_04630 [Bacteroidia bacterium]|nr:hypothetical protein FACS189426_04940 [Bacteroidia bacterium]GHT27705.1 hypothetical protein FACS189432_04630 [Bacteroidia bacterium]
MANNIDKIMLVAEALGDLRSQVVFVGGSVAELYAAQPELSDIRPTIDVDCVVDIKIVTYSDYARLEEKLRKLGFANDISDDAPICRKTYRGIIVDFMPVNPDILGFSNHWYKTGYENRIEKQMPDNTAIYIFPVEYYVATKLEALNSRGGTDIRGSHDWEDIVYVLDNCDYFLLNLQKCKNEALLDYFKNQFNKLLNNSNIREIIYSVLPFNSEKEQVDKIFAILCKAFNFQICII